MPTNVSFYFMQTTKNERYFEIAQRLLRNLEQLQIKTQIEEKKIPNESLPLPHHGKSRANKRVERSN